MSRWTDQFKSHPFHADWTTLQALLESENASPDVERAHAEELARLRKVFSFVSGLLDSMDPEIVNPALLTNLQSYVQAAFGETSNYFANSNLAHLQNANSNFDTIVTLVSQNPFVAFGSAKALLTRAVTSYAETMSSYAERYEAEMQGLAQGVVKDYTALDGRAEVANQALQKLEGRISGMETALPNQLAGYNTDFQASEKARADKFESWTGTYQDKLDQQFSAAASKFAVGEDVMTQHLDRAGKVLGSVVDTAQAGAYATYATEEKKNANLYRYLAIALMAAAALVLFLPELAHFTKMAAGYAMNWKAALYRLPFSLILFAPALYLAKESSKHRINEVVNRRRQHILTTIGPYLALLEPKKAEEIKAEVAKSIFADNLPSMDEKSPEAANVVAQVTNLVAMVLKRVK